MINLNEWQGQGEADPGFIQCCIARWGTKLDDNTGRLVCVSAGVKAWWAEAVAELGADAYNTRKLCEWMGY